jgi:hypothetical protein
MQLMEDNYNQKLVNQFAEHYKNIMECLEIDSIKHKFTCNESTSS